MNERALSERQAWACEYALEDRCRCRCGGKMHGAKRVNYVEHLAELAADDPHHIEPEERSSLGPLRLVVKVRRYKPLYAPSYGRSIELHLECGHVLHRKSSKGEPRKMHCFECRQRGPKPGTNVLVRQVAGISAGTQRKTVQVPRKTDSPTPTGRRRES